jgi:peptidyl-tRNA hydrolase
MQAGEHHTERCRDKQYRKRRADKEDEVLADGLEQGRRKIACDEATNDRLGEWKEPARHRQQCCAAADKDHSRAHRAEKERRWQADYLEEGDKNSGGYQEERNREKGEVIQLIHF